MFLEAKGPDGSSMTIEQMASEARAMLYVFTYSFIPFWVLPSQVVVGLMSVNA